ncbi:MAG: amidase [Haloquadratum sp.]
MPRSDEGAFATPTTEEIEALAADLGIPLGEDESEDYRTLASDAIEGSNPIRHADPFDPGLRPDDYAGRNGGYRPDADEDPHNAWIRKLSLGSDADGPLSATSVGLKDSIALAGVELTLGSSVMEGFVPEIDATVVHRLRDAGAEIAGKLNMESFAFSGTGGLSDYGPVTNPRSEDHLAGGSSSGSAVAPVVGDCDVALGTDQAGSVRIPSSWCGLVGIKPTYGLVPYTGVVPLERSLDHVGPMATSVEAVARTLEVLAGEDVADGIRLDDRQPTGVAADDYVAATGEDPAGLSVAFLQEGFGWEFSEPAVDEAVRATEDAFESRGVDVDRVSVPRHRQSIAIWGAIATQGGARLLAEGSVGTNHEGWSWPQLARVMDSFRDARARDLPPTVKRTLLAAAYLDEEYGIEPYAKARSLAMAAEREFDAVLDDYDAIALPTTVVRAFEHVPDIDRVDALQREVATIANTSMFNVTGHPAISVPCGRPDGRPVGLMLVGSHFDEPTLFRLASGVEDAVADG